MLTFVQKRLFYFFPVLFCFCLPFGSRALSICIALWFVSSLFNLKKENIVQGIRNRNFILMLLFFALTVVSSAFFSTKTEALSAIEVKLSFFFIPYLLFCFQWPLDIMKRCIVSFVSGCFFACFLLIARAFFYALGGQTNYFFYTSFSFFIHASYFAMYLVLALVFVLALYGKWFKGKGHFVYTSFFFIIIFIVTVFLCSSKMGLIGLFVCLPVAIAYRLKLSLTTKTTLLLIVAASIFFLTAYKLFPGPFQRMNAVVSLSKKQIDKTSSESTAVRVLIWQQSLEIIKRNLIFGIGAGNTNNALCEAYKQNGLIGAYKNRLNAHNQYLQTFIGLGLPGFVLLLLLTLWQFVRAIVKRHFLLFILLLLTVINFLVESMLETAAGVLFFSFFYCFLNRVDESKLRDA